MMRSVPLAERSERRPRSATKPVVRAGIPVNAKILWALCAAALGSVSVVAWKVQEPAHEAVVLSPQSRALPQGASAPFMEPLAEPTSPPPLPSMPSVVPLAVVPAALASASASASASAAQAAELSPELSPARAGSAAAAAGVSSVPASTWPVVTRSSNGVPLRSDMRYLVNAPPSR